jgi:GntR family transcriptional regulator
MALTEVRSPLYRKIYEQLADGIYAGQYPRGIALPSEAQLGKEFGVSLITVRRAIQELALDGLVERRQGAGNFVRGAPRNVDIGLSNFTSEVANGRLRLVRTLLVDDLIALPVRVAKKLALQPGSMARHLVRLDNEGGMPLSVDEVYLPPALAKGITTDIASSPLFLHEWQINSGLRLVSTDYEITVQMAQPKDVAWLQIPANLPLLVTVEVGRDAQGQPKIWIESRYRSDRCRLSGNVILAQSKTEHGTVGE